MKYFIVDENQANERLDKFLSEKLSETRSQIKKAILNDRVLINDEPAKVHEFLNIKDKVTVKDFIVLKDVDKEKEAAVKEKNITFLKPTILKETDDYIVLEKPSGMLVHSTSKNEQDTLVHWLVKKYPEIQKIADPISLNKRDKIFRPGIVHRLDREVSGLMVIARTQTSFEDLKSQFQQKYIKKEYTALVIGQLAEDKGLIDFEISRKTSGEKMAAHPANSNKGKPSLTEYIIEEKYLKFTLVKINLLTGRTNQIRVHFFALGNPIAGDSLYCLKEKAPKVKIPRILLHANSLSFKDLNGEVQAFESKLPEEFNQVISQLK
jgi:23S rRNA pseudouridine1911/1915/1917 synthase